MPRVHRDFRTLGEVRNDDRVLRGGLREMRKRRYHEKRHDSHQRVDHHRIIFRAGFGSGLVRESFETGLLFLNRQGTKAY